MGEDQLILTTKDDRQRLFLGLCALSLLCAIASPIIFYGEGRGEGIYLGRIAFFLAVSYIMYRLAIEKEIRLHRKQGVIEFVDTKPFSMPVSKNYRISELRIVKYCRGTGRWSWGRDEGVTPPAMDFIFKDGTRAGGFVRQDYVPNQKDFPGVKIEYA